MARPAKKTTKPKPPMAERLERIRTESGLPTLRRFYDRLAAHRVVDFPTYAAAATYHGSPWRAPSVPYLQAIARAFPNVNPLWLLGAVDGPVTEAEARATRATTRNALEEAFRALLGPSLEEIVRDRTGIDTHAAQRVYRAVEDLTQVRLLAQGIRAPAAADWDKTAEAIAAPFEVLGLDPARIDARAHAHALVLIAEALYRAVTSPRAEKEE